MRAPTQLAAPAPAPASASAPARRLLLVLVLLSALPPVRLHPRGLHCARLLQDGATAARARGEFAVPQLQNVTVVWGTRTALAAAALLHAALLAAGFSNVGALHDAAAARGLCALLRRPRPPGYLPGARAVVVAPAVGVGADGGRCPWGAGAGAGGGALSVMGAGAAPVAARLHVRLAARAASLALCLGATAWAFYERADHLRACGFAPPAGDGAESGLVYVLRGEWLSAEKQLKARLLDSNGAVRLTVADRPLNRTELARLVFHGDRSFLFVDAELWAEAAHVRVLETRASSGAGALRVAAAYPLLVQTPALSELFAQLPLPRAAELRAVLERADLPAHAGDVLEAACALAREPSPPEIYAEWRGRAGRPVKHKAFVVVCERDSDYGAYREMLGVIGQRIYNTTDGIKLGIAIAIDTIDCLTAEGLIRDAVDLLGRYDREWPSRIVGAVVPADVAVAHAAYGKGVRLPLIAYDAVGELPGAPSTAGRTAQLSGALRRLLGACAPRSLAVLEESRDARLAPPDLAALLGACHRRNFSVESENETKRHLGELSDAGARIFLVNGGAAFAARVFAAARDLRLTRAAGYAWVALEYAAADDAASELEPLSVSLQWRGGSSAPAEDPAGLRAQLGALWAGRAWPRHAAPMADAVLALGESFRRLVERHPEMRDRPYTEEKLRYFWNGTRSENISGIFGPLRLDENGVDAPPVFIDRWGGAPGSPPRLDATWRAGDLGGAAELCPAPGPASECHVPGGDACHPRCHTTLVVGSAAAAVVTVAAVAYLAVAARRAYAGHIAGVRTNVMERMLAGRERAFAALAPYAVDRAALDRREELGAGHYGRVWRCLLRAEARGRACVVAAKEPLESAAPEEETRFLREACTLAALRHERVVRLVAVCLLDGPPLLLMEYALFGDLLGYLRARRHLAEEYADADDPDGEKLGGREEAAHVSPEALTRFAREAAEALAFLARRGVVHRDVRAANCLVDERRSLKLADFGLARQVTARGADGEYAMGGPRPVPVRYWAPESLAYGVSSAASDVWALGVLALELVTLGERPFGALPLRAVVARVVAGGRAPLPKDACADARRLVRACWRVEAALRPSAARVAAWLARRPRALRPALDAPEADDADSGFEETAFAELGELDA